QAEDGIRDFHVTGVQTCALPISITLFMVVMLLGMGVLMTPKEMLPDFFVTFIRPWVPIRFAADGLREIFYFGSGFYTGGSFITRSEERRVGKECRCRWSV